MTPRTELSAADITRQLVRMAYGDLTPFIDEHGYLTCSPRDLPTSAAGQISEISIVRTAEGTRIKVRTFGAARRRKSLKLVEQLAHHSDPAIRQLVQEERHRLSATGDRKTTPDHGS